MAKKTVVSTVSKTDLAEVPVVAVEGALGITNNTVASTSVNIESVFPAASIDALIAALTNPESRIATSQQLDTRIAARKAELEQLEMARRALDPQDNTINSVKKASIKKSKVIKVAKVNNDHVTDHATAILNTLKGEKNGLMIGDIGQKLSAMKHELDQRSLASYLWSMTKNGKLVKEGERGQFHYKPASSV